MLCLCCDLTTCVRASLTVAQIERAKSLVVGFLSAGSTGTTIADGFVVVVAKRAQNRKIGLDEKNE